MPVCPEVSQGGSTWGPCLMRLPPVLAGPPSVCIFLPRYRPTIQFLKGEVHVSMSAVWSLPDRLAHTYISLSLGESGSCSLLSTGQ